MPRKAVAKKGAAAKGRGKPAARKAAPAVLPVASFMQNQSGVSRFAALGKQFSEIGWGQASEVLREVRGVPTIFPWVDYVLRVGGWPTDRFGLIHGPSNEGKTSFVVGLMLSFLMGDHAAAYIDAESTTPPRWLRRLMGPYAEHPGFRALYPTSYEQTVDMVRAWCTTLGEAKVKGLLDPDTTGIVVVDSLRKLVPKKLLEKLAKEGAEGDEDDGAPARGRHRKKPGGVDGLGGRAAQFKAALNAAWMDQLTPLLRDTGTCMVAIGREYENSDVGGFGQVDDFKLGGGSALFFESAVVARVTVAERVRDEGGALVAEKHCVQIRKTKIEAKEVSYPRAYFHSTADGFDRARDVFALGREVGVIEQGGSWFSYRDVKLGQGEDAALRKLGADAELLRRVEDALRSRGVQADAQVVREEVPSPPA